MEGGLPHGRIPIADGAVDKEEVIVVARSNNLRPVNTASYRIVVDENDELKEMNKELREINRDLKQNNVELTEKNEILTEENSVNREMIMRFYADFGKVLPADLVTRLANIDARRQQHHHMPGLIQKICKACNGNEMNSDEDDDYIMDREDGRDDDDDLDDTDEDGGSEEVDGS